MAMHSKCSASVDIVRWSLFCELCNSTSMNRFLCIVDFEPSELNNIFDNPQFIFKYTFFLIIKNVEK